MIQKKVDRKNVNLALTCNKAVERKQTGKNIKQYLVLERAKYSRSVFRTLLSIYVFFFKNNLHHSGFSKAPLKMFGKVLNTSL